MRSHDEHKLPVETSAYRELQVLSEVDGSPEVTQRELAQRVGIALGLTNLLLRNLAQKGYIRVTRAGWKRWLYNLTPEGLSQKIHLTVAYIHRVLDHYQSVRQKLREQLQPLALHEESRVAIYGTDEFAELVYLGLKELGIEEIYIFGPNTTANRRFLGMPVHDVSTLKPDEYERVVVGLLGSGEGPYLELLERGVSSDQLVTFFSDSKEREGG